MKITRNVGGVDRVLRAGIGSGMVYMGFFSEILASDTISSIFVGVLGAIFVFTAIVGNCPLYNFIGFSTASCKTPITKS